MMKCTRVVTRREPQLRASGGSDVQEGGRREHKRSRALERSPLLVLSTIGLALLTACGEDGGTVDPPPGEEVLGVSEHAPTGDQNVSANGLVVSYDMSSSTENDRLRDFSERGLHGLVEGTTLVETPRGKGREFKVASDRIALPAASDFDLDGPLSIVARFRVDLAGQHQHLIACDDKFVLWLTPGDRARFANTLGSAIETNAPLSSGEWHVVVAIWRGTAGDAMTDSNIELWIDGARAPVGFRSASGSPPYIWQHGSLNEVNACFVGFEMHAGDPQHQNLPFFGVIDEVMLFERALTPAEVAALSVSP